MSLIKWEQKKPAPFQSLRDEMDRVFDDFFRGWPATVTARTSLAEGAFVPSVNVREEKDRFLVDVEVPGMAREDIKLAVEENYLTVSGERKMEKKEKEEGGWRIVESSYGSFRRVIPLPDAVEAGKAEAKLKDGVLRLTLPKAAPSPNRAVDIKVE